MHLRRLLAYVDCNGYLTWNTCPREKMQKETQPVSIVCPTNTLKYHFSLRKQLLFQLRYVRDVKTAEVTFCLFWSLNGLLWEAPQMHRFFHFLGLNVLISVQNQLFKHHVECVFSSSFHRLSHCVLHCMCIFPFFSQLCFCFVLQSDKILTKFSHSFSPLFSFVQMYFNNPFPYFPCCPSFFFPLFFPVYFVSRLFHITMFTPLCFLLLVKQFSVLLCRITLYDYQAMCRTNKESSDSAHSLLDVSTVNFMSTFPCTHQRKLLQISHGHSKPIILIWNA